MSLLLKYLRSDAVSQSKKHVMLLGAGLERPTIDAELKGIADAGYEAREFTKASAAQVKLSRASVLAVLINEPEELERTKTFKGWLKGLTADPSTPDARQAAQTERVATGRLIDRARATDLAIPILRLTHTAQDPRVVHLPDANNLPARLDIEPIATLDARLAEWLGSVPLQQGLTPETTEPPELHVVEG